MRVILASKSPRRRELLGKIIPEFEIIVAPTDESLEEGISPLEGVRILAERKGEAVYNKLIREGENLSDTLIISSDTLVALGNRALGKPADEEDAFLMLRSLSGRVHSVHTGVAVRLGDRVFSGTDTTSVEFLKLSDSQIREYILTGEPMDKAGSYGIQGEGGRFVKEFIGEYDTVVGLSLKLTGELIKMAEECYDKR